MKGTHDGTKPNWERLSVAYPIGERLRKSRSARKEFHLCLK